MDRQMTFGFLYDLRNPPQWERSAVDIYRETLDFVAYTEELGFDGAWVPEHHVTHEGYVTSPLIALAAMAARTKRMKLGTGVALSAFYNPVRFAEDTATLDVIADGRLEIAVALGYRRRETDAYGIDFSSRTTRMDEFLQIVPRLWAGETVTFQGKHFVLQDAFVAPRPPRGSIPLLGGAYSEKGLARVARYCDGYYGAQEHYPVYEAKLREQGKDVPAGRFYQATVPLIVDHDPKAAKEKLAPYFHHVSNMYGVWLGEDHYGGIVQVDEAPQQMSLDDFKKTNQILVLTPAEAIEFFREMSETVPVEHVTIAVPPGVSMAGYAKHAELFAKDVLPAFA
jgi:alkanesulfonate monooxygenase SsuD/methylene tetrahydromethanopterin reductase-like flavin-dependent oxidoreductase (luciferase family)